MAVRPHRRFVARVRSALDSDAAGLRQSLAATLVSSGGDLLAGLTLASLSDTLSLLPGLVVLVPAAIGMRGNIFGALGSRFGTAIHTGTFRLSRLRNGVRTGLAQSTLASSGLSPLGSSRGSRALMSSVNCEPTGAWQLMHDFAAAS